MAHPQNKPPSLQDHLRELEDEVEKKKVRLTPEVQTYIKEHLDVVQEKLVKKEPVYEADMAFIDEVKMWVGMPEEWREKYPSIEEMKGAEEMKNVTSNDLVEANKRSINLKQWLDLLHVAEADEHGKEWIDKQFNFPGSGKIVSEEYLNLDDCTSLTSLPEGLSVGGDLWLNDCTSLTSLPEELSVGGNLDLRGCTSLTSLPEELSVGGGLLLSKNLNDQVKKDAERLKEERKIKGEIKFYDF